MSTSVIHARPSSSWKQEVNRRLAEHRCRKPAAQPAPLPTDSQSSASRQAQEAAARVAARYAMAPSFSEALAGEARAALCAAEVASEAALHARAAAQSVLDNIEAASLRPAAPAPVPVAPASTSPGKDRPAGAPVAVRVSNAQPQSSPGLPRKESMGAHVTQQESLAIRWAPNFPARTTEPVELHAGRGENLFEDERWKPAAAEPLVPFEEIEIVEPARLIHGNIIEFPRELVATRNARPRLAGGAAEEANVQLTIFEVDPVTIAPEAAAETLHATLHASSPARPKPTWTESARSGVELDRQQIEALLEEPAPAAAEAHPLQPASMNRRLLALALDATLVAGALLGAAALALTKAQFIPGPRAIELGSGVALAAATGLYLALFFTLARSTPGMKYARIQLSTFDGFTPSRAQRCGRLAAMLLSVLPAGLGLAWSLFDDDSLCWHDRLSRTYLANL